MSDRRRRAVVACVAGLVILGGAWAHAGEWEAIDGTHVIVYHRGGDAFAGEVSRRAESAYRDIARELGFAKHDRFWLWGKRASIYLYASRDAFLAETGSPGWSAGKAHPGRREIHAYQSGPDFLDSVLPHEMAHLILRDFVGFEGDIPLWLNEGVAQWAETSKRPYYRQQARELLGRHRLMTLRSLVSMTPNLLMNSRATGEFYAASASVVGYLIQAHGSEAFRKLCGQIRDGKSLDDALRFTYPDRMRTLEQLESAWKKNLEEAP